MAAEKKLTRNEARAALPEGQRATFDELCDEVISWSRLYYGVTFVSYVILMELVKSGWTKGDSLELIGFQV